MYFLGAGPGALDLLTVRAQRILQEVDLILYADSLVSPEIARLAKPGADVLGSASLTLEEIVALMVGAARAGKLVARVHSGDPSIYGAIHEQAAALRAAGVTYEVVPGVSSLFAAAATLGVELTVPGVTQTVIVTRAEGRTLVPEREALRSLAAHRATIALFLSVGMMEKVVGQLMEGGYPASTPVAVVYRASWPDQQTVVGTLSEIAPRVGKTKIDRQAIVLVGDALGSLLGEETGAASQLYSSSFSHGYREGK